MAALLKKLKTLFKRKSEDDDNNESKPAKRIKYVSTPGLQFTPRQICTKRMKRQYYIYHEVINTTEDRNYEFKAGAGMIQDDVLKDYICKYGPAFLNAEGGVMLGGITDDGVVEGLYLYDSQIIRIIDTVRKEFAKFRPIVRDHQYTINFIPVESSRDRFLKVIELWIDKGDPNSIYENGRHQVFVRRDGGVQGPLRPLAIKDLVIQKYNQVLQNRKQIQEEAAAKPTFQLVDELHAIEEEKVSETDSSIEIIEVKKGSSNFKPGPGAPIRDSVTSKDATNRKDDNSKAVPVGNSDATNRNDDNSKVLPVSGTDVTNRKDDNSKALSVRSSDTINRKNGNSEIVSAPVTGPTYSTGSSSRFTGKPAAVVPVRQECSTSTVVNIRRDDINNREKDTFSQQSKPLSLMDKLFHRKRRWDARY